MLSTCSLTFHGSSDKLIDHSKGNFLSVIELLANYDPVLEELLRLPAGTTKYLSPKVQNKFISLLAIQVPNDIKDELQNAPFFSIILDTTQDITKDDQLSVFFFGM